MKTRATKSILSQAMSAIAKGRWNKISLRKRREHSAKMHAARYGKK